MPALSRAIRACGSLADESLRTGLSQTPYRERHNIYRTLLYRSLHQWLVKSDLVPRFHFLPFTLVSSLALSRDFLPRKGPGLPSCCSGIFCETNYELQYSLFFALPVVSAEQNCTVMCFQKKKITSRLGETTLPRIRFFQLHDDLSRTFWSHLTFLFYKLFLLPMWRYPREGEMFVTLVSCSLHTDIVISW